MANSKPRQWPAYLSMSWYTLRATLRNPATVAFGLAFPLVFIAIFGLIGSSSQSLSLGLPKNSSLSNPVIEGVKSLPFIKTETADDEVLDQKLRIGKLDGILLVLEKDTSPPTYDVYLTTTSGNPTGAATANSVVGGIVDKLNLKLSGVTIPPATLTSREVSGRQFRYIDFVLPGQIGFSLLSTAMFSTVFGFIALKRMLVFKRMFATPVRALTILLAQGTSRMVIGLTQTILIIGIGVVAFNFFLPHGIQTFLELIFITIVGLISFMGFGIFASGFSNNENSAGPVVNLITLPQFLISGVFFPTESLPSWIQPVANNLPLSYFNQAVRKVTTEGGTLLDTIPFLIGLLIWGAVMYLLATKTFKWE